MKHAARTGSSSLLSRLRVAVGLPGLAALTLGSGPCGSCPEGLNRCPSLDELAQLRSRALNDWGLAGAGDSASAGESGVGGGAPAGYWVSDFHQRVVAWNPEQGCPTGTQYSALLEYSEGDSGVAQVISTSDGTCCYVVRENCGEGRPFLVEGSPRVAELPRRYADVSQLDVELADLWSADALMEHASVASFARLTLQLLALGAPLELIEASQQASLDELRHARICFEEAARHAGHGVHPGRLPVHGALDDSSLDALIESNLIEGCVGETLAAVRLLARSQTAERAELAQALIGMSEDEARHAELAWRILGWSLQVARDTARRGISKLLSQGLPRTAAPLKVEDRAAWAAAGCLTRSERERLDHLTWKQTLAPLLREVLLTSASKYRPDVAGRTPATMAELARVELSE